MRSLIIKVLSAAIILVSCVQLLTGCALFDKYKKWDGSVEEVTEDSVVCVKDFATAVAGGDFEEAKTYLHPNCTPSADELKQYVIDAEAAHDFDLTEDVSFQFEDFNPELDLEHIQFNVEGSATIGDDTVLLSLTVRKDEHGFGIYEVSIQ